LNKDTNFNFSTKPLLRLYFVMPFFLSFHVLFLALARHTLLQFLACAVGIERIANVYGLCVG